MVNLLPTLLCLAAGVILIVVECLAPGIGAAGIFGVLALAAAVILQIGNTTGILFVLALALLLIAAALLVLFRLGAKGKLSRSRFALSDRIGGSPRQDALPPVGAQGVALTHLRPAGVALIDGRRRDVQADGAFIEKDTRIRVSGRDGLRLLVEPAAPEEPDEQPRQDA